MNSEKTLIIQKRELTWNRNGLSLSVCTLSLKGKLNFNFLIETLMGRESKQFCRSFIYLKDIFKNLPTTPILLGAKAKVFKHMGLQN